MQAIILAAGEGTRMRPLSASVPKPMLPVAERPIVAHTVEAAAAAGADEIVLVVGYEADAVRRYFGSEYAGASISYAVQMEQSGTADAVRVAARHIDGAFAVLNGDNLYDQASVARLFEAGPSVGAFRVENPSQYGVLTAETGRVTGITEKPDDPPSDLVNTGAYVLPEKARNWLDVPVSERGEREITDVLARVIAEFDVEYVELDRWMDVGRPWELLEANEWWLGELSTALAGDISPDAHVEGSVVVEEGATVKPGVVIEGSALIRSGATVGPNAYIRGTTLVDEGATIGHSVEVKNSLLFAGATVGHLSYVGDSILGRDVNFGAGTTVANVRHDEGLVEHTVKGERVSTGRRTFGAVVGDGAKTGINTSLGPGVTLSPGVTTGPGEDIVRDRTGDKG